MSTPADATPRFGLHQPWRQLALALAAGLLGLIANAGAPMLGSGLPMRLDVVIVLCVAITAGPAWAALSATIATALVCWHVGRRRLPRRPRHRPCRARPAPRSGQAVEMTDAPV